MRENKKKGRELWVTVVVFDYQLHHFLVSQVAAKEAKQEEQELVLVAQNDLLIRRDGQLRPHALCHPNS